MHRTTISLALLCWLASSCSAPDPYSGPGYERALTTPALPYVVKIDEIHFSYATGTTGEAVGTTVRASHKISDETPLLITDETSDTLIRESIRQALEQYQVFSRVALDDDALLAEQLTPELVLDVTITVDPSRPPLRHLNTSTKWANLGLWLLAGVPGWIMEDTLVEAGVTALSFSLRAVSPDGNNSENGDSRDRAALLQRNVDLTDANKLNFMRRAGWSEYFFQIIIPPFIVESDRDVADEALLENYISRMQSEIPRELKEGLSRDMVGKTPQLVVSAPLRIGDKIDSTAGMLEVIVFSSQQPDVVQVHRIAPGNGAKPKLILEEELEPLQENEWKMKSRRALGADVDYLEGYLYAAGCARADALNDTEMGTGGYLRFTVSFRNAPARTWTIPY